MPALHVFHGPPQGPGDIIPVHADPFRIGRNPDCDLCVPAIVVNWEHARIVRDAGRFFLEDNASRNGTFLNGQFVQPRAELSHYDQIRVGDSFAYFFDTPCFSDVSRQVTLDPLWRTATVLSLAQASHEEGVTPLSPLDPARFAVLSDALEEAGCTEQAILEHLRSPDPHVRACWALGLILGGS